MRRGLNLQFSIQSADSGKKSLVICWRLPFPLFFTQPSTLDPVSDEMEGKGVFCIQMELAGQRMNIGFLAPFPMSIWLDRGGRIAVFYVPALGFRYREPRRKWGETMRIINGLL